MDIKVFGRDGSDTGRTASLDAAVFDVEPNDHALWLVVRAIQASGRQGTHKAKERAEVAGSTRKLYRQKGTGFARAGSAKSPIRKSGGTIFGPRPRNYALRINKKTKHVACRSALTYKAREEAIRLLERFEMEAPSTRELAGLLKNLELGTSKVLVLTDGKQPHLYKSGRNMPKVNVRDAADVTALDVLDAQTVLIQEGALETLTNRLTATTSAGETATTTEDA